MPLNITAKLGMDAKGFKAGAERARQTASSMRQKIGKQFGAMAAGFAGIFAIATVSQQVTKTIEWATRMRDLATQFGVTTEFVQKMDYAFKQTGMDAEIAFKAMRKMMLNVAIAQNEMTSKMTAAVKLDAFKQLGLSAKELDNLGPEKLFMKIAANLKDANTASAALHDALNVVFGKAGSELLVTFQSDLAAMSERMEELGLVEDESIQRLGALGDKFEEFKTQNRGVWADIVSGAMTVWMRLVDFVKVGVDMMGEQIVRVGDALGAVGTAFGKTLGAIKSGDFKGAFAAAKEGMKAMANLGKTAFVNPVSFYGEMGDRMLGRETERDDRLKQKSDQQKLNEEMQQFDAIQKERKKVSEAMDALQEKAVKRQFEALNPAQQLLALEKKLNQEKAKLAKMPRFYSEAEIAAAGKGLDKIAAQEKRKSMEQSNLERGEQQQALVDAGEEFKKKQAEIAKEEKPVTQVAMAGQATFGAMARIGGQMGLKNPVLDTQKKQLLGIEEIKKHSELTANAVRILAGN